MQIRNNPFSRDVEEIIDESITISLEEGKRLIPNVSMNEFYNAFQNSVIPRYLHDCYYMHYLCIIGDIVRIRNFIFDLQHRNISVSKIINYNKLPEFDFGSCLHTCMFWNNDTQLPRYLIEQCNASLRVRNKSGFTVNEYFDYS